MLHNRRGPSSIRFCEHFAPRLPEARLRQGMKRRHARAGPRMVRTNRIAWSEIRRVMMMSASIRCASSSLCALTVIPVARLVNSSSAQQAKKVDVLRGTKIRVNESIELWQLVRANV